MKKSAKKPVSEKAVITRIKKKLAVDGESLRRSRSATEKQNFGEWFVVDSGDVVIAHHCTIKKLAKEMNTIRADEYIADE